MNTKNKILIIGCSCLLAVAGFTMTTIYSDHDNLTEMYRQTTNGDYYRKHILVDEDFERIFHEGVGESESDKSGGSGNVVISADLPEDFDPNAWAAYYKASQMSDVRRAIMLEAMDCKAKGVVYHQIRPGYGGTHDKCLCACDAEHYPGITSFDVRAMASYNVDDPLYLDCSYFVKHCYWSAGLEMASSNTDGLFNSSEFVNITRDELIPGDIAVRPGHVILFAGFNKDGGAVWIELWCHAGDCKFSAYEVDNRFKYRRFGALVNDTTFVGGKS